MLYGIMLATIIIVCVLIILSSYQVYLTNIIRFERDYEAEFKNIEYSNVEKIKEDKNIKEVSVIQKIGTAEEEMSKSEGISTKINLIAYDKNSEKNNKLELIEGRMPNNTSEIVLSKQYYFQEINLGEEFELTINGNKKKYTVVGIAKKLVNDVSGGFSFKTIAGAITYCDEAKLNENSIVDVAIKTKNINKIYETTNNLSSNLNLYKTSEEKENNLVYNKNLLRYSLVKVQNEKEEGIRYTGDVNAEEFGEDLTKIVIITMSVIGITAIIVIYTSFKITYSGRVKELGMLTSIRNE